MIVYKTGVFGFLLLYRLHGSALVKAFLPAFISTAVLLLVANLLHADIGQNDDNRPIDHPYAIGCLMVAFTFLMTFRANFAYNRYWEATTSIHQMFSKWMDVGAELAAFHYQCSQYDEIRPPAFGKHKELRNLTRERTRLNEMTVDEMKEQLDEIETEQKSKRPSRSLLRRASQRMMVGKTKKLSSTASVALRDRDSSRSYAVARPANFRSLEANYPSRSPRPANGGVNGDRVFDAPPSARPTTPSVTIPVRGGSLRSIGRVTSVACADGGVGKEEPSLFLQEAAHLLSLLSAVALSTLRDDAEGVEAPLVEYVPGDPWPPVDPDELSAACRQQFHQSNPFITVLMFLFGISRNEKKRTLYNAARPFHVVGGISDAEVNLLQNARGPFAKTTLCTMWLHEFITREYLAGSTGKVAPPILSRLYQMISDGMLGYNQARKVAHIPFPFVHAQVTALFIFVVVALLPVLMYSFVNNMALAACVNFFTVLCFTALHEVARELENPFKNVPNDLPLVTFQAQFNESLLTTYAGFHPDSWWEVERPSTISEDTEQSSEGAPPITVNPRVGQKDAVAGDKKVQLEGDRSAIYGTFPPESSSVGVRQS